MVTFRAWAVVMAAVVVSCSSDGGDQLGGESVSTVPGSADRECVDVDQLRAQNAWVEQENPDGSTARVLDVRSGDFRAGNFYELLGVGTIGDPDFRAKIYWVPDDPEVAKTESLTVVVEPVNPSQGEPVSIELGGDGNYASAGDRYFWPSSIPLPGEGRWRLTAEAPDHWGCFELTLTA